MRTFRFLSFRRWPCVRTCAYWIAVLDAHCANNRGITLQDSKLGTTRYLQPELELLVACARLAIDKVSLLLDSDGPRLNWDVFYRLAAVQGVLSPALHSLSLSNAVGIPEAIMAALRRDHRDRVARDLCLTAETLRLVRRLEIRGVASIVLKGCAISNYLY